MRTLVFNPDSDFFAKFEAAKELQNKPPAGASPFHINWPKTYYAQWGRKHGKSEALRREFEDKRFLYMGEKYHKILIDCFAKCAPLIGKS